MRRLSWSARAIGDLTTIHRYVAQDNTAAAGRLVDDLYEAAASLRFLPERGRLRPDRTRELVHPLYVIRYRVAARTIRILHIRHSRRRPN